ncbi:MAG: C39 family peptidase [Candidatus Thorarchaeota archaeon]
MRYSALIFMAILLLAAIPVASNSTAMSSASVRQSSQLAYDGDGLLSEVPYVWQEINGFCSWAATAMAMQHAGAAVELHDLFALSTVGFSYAYIRFNDTMLMFPGAIYQQVEPTKFAADLYGLNFSIYLDSELTGADLQTQLWAAQGINAQLLDGQTAAFNLMRQSIDDGYPLIASVDPSWLPPQDYDILRTEGLTGGAHGVLITGYDDASGIAMILDPGVGSFGEDFGYPDDGRYEYNITYTALNFAWSSRYYISTLIKPGDGPIDDPSSLLGPHIRDRLLGVGTSYSPDAASAYIWQFGEKGFRAMSSDMTVEGLSLFLSVFDGIENEREFKTSLLLFIGLGLESQTTLQYLSYKPALTQLPALMPDISLTNFTAAGEQALPHFQALVDNSSLVNPGNLTFRDSLVFGTFWRIADMYNATGNMEVALEYLRTDLDSISTHLLGIADSWQAAGNALTKIWPNDFIAVYGLIFAVAGVAVVALIITIVWWIRKTPSQ